MARLARIVVPDCPHHVTARGNRREPIFFQDGDQDIYCDMLAEEARLVGVGARPQAGSKARTATHALLDRPGLGNSAPVPVFHIRISHQHIIKGLP